MNVTPTGIEGLLVMEPQRFVDDRGFFEESWNAKVFAEATGFHADFVQDNHSRSVRGVLRGLHYQLPNAQAKLVRCTAGTVWDVAVDIRRSSPTFGEWFGLELSGDDQKQFWVPEGFAHGFVVLSHSADVLYKTTAFYDPKSDRSIRWDDAEVGVAWPSDVQPIVSDKDEAAPALADAMLFD